MPLQHLKPIPPPFPLRTRFPSRLERAGYKLHNYLDNSLYPVRPIYFGAATAAAAAFYSKYSSGLLNLLPTVGESTIARYSRIGITSLATAYLPVFTIRFILRHFYFKYKRWLFENPKKPSIPTKIWAGIRYLLTFAPPRLKSCDSLLPRQHVPRLEETVQRYMASIKQLHTGKQLADIEGMAQQFLAVEGRKLQTMTRLYALLVDNYVTGFWEKLVYLQARQCPLINSSVAHVDYFEPMQATRAARAARVAYIETQSQLAIDQQTFSPASAGLICTSHLDKMYAITREPGEKVDKLRRYGITRHIVVIYNGGMYKVHTVDEHDRIYNVDELTKEKNVFVIDYSIFVELIIRSDTKTEGPAGRIPALTTDDRTQWHCNRHRFFEAIPKNMKALREIESAIVALSLDDDDDMGYDPKNPEKLSRFVKSMMTGNGANRWTDKAAFNYVVCANGAFGGIIEHSVADGCDFGAIQENFAIMEQHIVPYRPREEQLKREKMFDAEKQKMSKLRFAERLEIDVNDEMALEIDRCYATQVRANDNLHVSSLIFRHWGRERIKECGCSPDAFIQMALQLANYRDQGRFTLTYEAASPRFYRNTRTETLRTVTDDSCEFVRAMENNDVDKAELLRQACKVHSDHNRDCMVGKGVDRHLFVLYVMAQATGIRSPFLDHVIQQEWLLSTSHAPNMMNNRTEDGEFEKFAWLGGAFGAVAENGYGVAYRLAGTHSICVHITSYHSAQNTDSDRFRAHLERALKEMSSLFD